MTKNERDPEVYRIKVLDMKYLVAQDYLSFQYQVFEVEASNEEQAVKEAKASYKIGKEPAFYEEIPILLKMFCVFHGPLVKAKF